MLQKRAVSQHIYGRALDFNLGSKLADAMAAARAMCAVASASPRIPGSSMSIPGR
jgi:hypothetical protein